MATGYCINCGQYEITTAPHVCIHRVLNLGVCPEQHERCETFKAVALAKINELELDHVRRYAAGVANPEVEFLGRLSEGCFLRFSNITEAILAGAQEFSTKGKVGR